MVEKGFKLYSDGIQAVQTEDVKYCTVVCTGRFPAHAPR